MRLTILIPHFKTLKMTAYTVAQYLKYIGSHGVDIIVINNSFGDDSIKGLEPFKDSITIIDNHSDKTTSHGTAYDLAMKYVKTEWVLCSESDSFPTKPFIEYYESLIDKNYDVAGSLLSLSGGSYVHPAGMLLNKKTWEEAEKYCNEIEYSYFPNMFRAEDFDFHLMVHKSMIEDFLEAPEDYIDLGKSYLPYSIEKAKKMLYSYEDIAKPFHNGMGKMPESLKTFGQRNTGSGVTDVVLDNKKKLINRVGLEPGQWLCYFSLSRGKNIAVIPTEIKWLPNRGAQQQEYTLNEAGIKHLWGVSAYHKAKVEGFEDVITFKEKQVNDLYNSLPDNQKVEI